MFDCGPAATYKLVRMGLMPTEIDHLFFTHHHYDHNADYACFLLCRWDQHIDSQDKLKTWGHPPTKEITECLIDENGAYFFDWNARVEHPDSKQTYEARGDFCHGGDLSLK
jgi:ribonuclease Z